jgi:dipeptidyl-peptidase-4
MRKMMSLLCAALLCSALFAGNRVIDTRPAHDGRLLTMEEVILSRKVRPGGVPMSWPREEAPWTAFTREDGLYVTNGSDTLNIARSEQKGIVYGESVSRNEFGIGEGWYFSPSGTRLAFFRKDERGVTEFPLLDITSRTGSLRSIRYPMNGMTSEQVSVGVFDTRSPRVVYLQVDDFTPECYLTNITWSPDEKSLYVQVVDRSQHHMHLNQYDARTGAFVRTLLTEDNEAWIEPRDPLYFIKGRSDLFLYRTDNRDGYRNLYLCDTLGTIRRLTQVDADVAYVGNDGKSVFYTSAEVSPVENHLMRIDLRLPKKNAVRKARLSTPVNLTPERGWHIIRMKPDCSAFYDRYSNLNTPGITLLRNSDGTLDKTLHTAEDPLKDYASCRVELGTVASEDGAFDNYYRLIYPMDFDPAKKYPLIVYVYGGPHSQMVTDSWLAHIRLWEMLMAQKGYFVYIQDNRGTENRGAAFEKAINRRCGAEEMKDQMAGVRRLMNLPYIDASRIGDHGWSYGGFMTISLMTTYPEVFQVGVAGGPVIDWKWYEVMYGERYMDNPETNPEGFAATSLIGKASQLKGRLLICQGAVDNTCVWQHSLSFVQACIDQGIQLDYFPYPVAEHNVYGKNRVHLMDKVTAYFEEHLK